MSELEPRKRPAKALVPKRFPQEIVPVPIEEAREFVHAAVGGSGLVNPALQIMAGWMYFEPRVRFSRVDDTHTRIELDVVGLFKGAEIFLYPERRAEIDRFFVALQDELDRRERWRRPSPPPLP